VAIGASGADTLIVAGDVAHHSLIRDLVGQLARAGPSGAASSRLNRVFVPGEMEWELYDAALEDGIGRPAAALASPSDPARFVGLAPDRDLR
jgi:Icc-related predicted phosphoesterase